MVLRMIITSQHGLRIAGRDRAPLSQIRFRYGCMVLARKV
jgi:hypothetical protein